jgi:hypothetical protein
MSDKRSAQRRRCLIGARVILAHQASNISCVVRSLSETGAKLEFEAVQLLPHEFTLQLATGVVYDVTNVAWQRGQQIGVVFKEGSSATGEAAFATTRQMNEPAFQEEISAKVPSVAPHVVAKAHQLPGSAAVPSLEYPRSDFGVEYRRRMAELSRKSV